MDLQLTALSLLVGYLMGSVSFARVVSRLAAPGSEVPEVTDLHLEGSDQVFHLGTVSASSVSARHGSKLGFLVFLLDLAKVAVPVLLFRLWLPSGSLLPGGGHGGGGRPHLARVPSVQGRPGPLGHLWHPPGGGLDRHAHRRGGGMVVGLFVLRSVLLAYVLGPWLVVPWLWWRTGDPAHVAFAVAAAIMFTVSMIPEIKQWRRISKEEKWDDYQTVMQLSGMGRGILKMAKKIGVVK
jgi:acyl phosphate:glycerol-3-phosphate acyltransferase